MTTYASTKTTLRDASLDWIAGLLTLVVIIQHIDDLTGYELGWKHIGGGRVFYFYMAWFFFKSGMFEKNGNIHNTYKKIWTHLVVPYLFFSIFSWIIWAPGYLYVHNWSFKWLIAASMIRFYQFGYIPNDGPLWFIAALIVCRFLYPLCHRYCLNNYVIAGFAWLSAYTYYLIWHHVEQPQYVFLPVPQGLMALSLYAIGAQWNHARWNRLSTIIFGVIYFVVLVFNFPMVALYLAGLTATELSWLYSLPLWCCGILFWNNIIKSMPRKFFKIFNFGYIGSHSMTYYCGHFIILTTLVFLYEEMGVTLFGMPLMWAMVVSCIILLPVADILLRRYIPWAVGAKPRVHKGVEIGAASDPLP